MPTTDAPTSAPSFPRNAIVRIMDTLDWALYHMAQDDPRAALDAVTEARRLIIEALGYNDHGHAEKRDTGGDE